MPSLLHSFPLIPHNHPSNLLFANVTSLVAIQPQAVGLVAFLCHGAILEATTAERARSAAVPAAPARGERPRQSLESTLTGVQFSALRFSSCETLGKPICFSKTQAFSSMKRAHFLLNFRQQTGENPCLAGPLRSKVQAHSHGCWRIL